LRTCLQPCRGRTWERRVGWELWLQQQASEGVMESGTLYIAWELGKCSGGARSFHVSGSGARND
jgi:hypothetical protein